MDETGPDGLPPLVARAWGLQEAAGRGPRPGLSLGRVVEAAVAVADAEGLAAVSMSRVGAELGASTMGLYRHVSGKDELLSLMVDQVWGTPPEAPSPEAGWRRRTEHWARSMRRVLEDHRWVLSVPIPGPPATPHQVAWMEQGLAALDGTRLAASEKMSVILLVSGFVRNEVGLATGIAAALASDPEAVQIVTRYGRILARVTDPERFPALTAVLETGALDDDDDDEELSQEFTFGLERILDGIDVLIRSREGADPAPGRS
jgi:AcrR family transcriptional regulator